MSIPDFDLEDTDHYYRQLDRDYRIVMYIESKVEEGIKNGMFQMQLTDNGWWVGFLDHPSHTVCSYDAVSDDMESAFDDCRRQVEKYLEGKALVELRAAGVR